MYRNMAVKRQGQNIQSFVAFEEAPIQSQYTVALAPDNMHISKY